MKRVLKTMLTFAAVAAAVILTGCDKTEGGGKGENVFAGEYTISATPLYSVMEAKDPAAVALTIPSLTEPVSMNYAQITGLAFGYLPSVTSAALTIPAEAEPMNMTYAQITALAYGYLPSVEVADDNFYVTFNADGTIKLTAEGENGLETIFPDIEDGFRADDITYSVNGDNLSILLSSNFLNVNFGFEDDPQGTAAMKAILANFNKGLVVYSAANNTARINFKYSISGKELKLFADKGLITDTWGCAKTLIDLILPALKEAEPEIGALIGAIVPQINPLFEGFNTIEIGAKATKK